jgi:glycosyltransferase involved in cell wall biosynthesis
MLADSLVAYGYEISVYTSADGRSACGNDDPTLRVERFRSAGLGRMLDRYRGDIRKYRQRLIEIKADINIFICWENWFLDNALPAFDEMPGKKIIVSHGTSALWTPPGIAGPIRRLAYVPHLFRYRAGLRKADAHVALTGLMQRERFYDNILLKEYPRVRTAIIPNGHGIAIRSSPGVFRSKYALEGKHLALCVSNYTWSKNQLELLRLFRDAELSGWTLVFIGSSDNGYCDRVKAEARRSARGAADVRVLSNVNDDIRSAYEDADLFLTASLTEAQPLMLLDAMRVGLPFIAYDVGCIAEFPGGLAVKDRPEFLAALRHLAGSSQARTRLGSLGRECTSRYYCWDHTGRSYARLLSELMGKGQTNGNGSFWT